MVRKRNKPFRFIGAWTLHDKFEDFVRNNWCSKVEWSKNVMNFSKACGGWNNVWVY